MSWVAVAIGGSALLGYMGSQNQASAAQNASQMQYQATQDAAKQQREMFDILNAQQQPYRQAGYESLSQIKSMLPQFTKTFTAADLNANLAPNYEFMKNQGLGATAQAMNVGSPGSNVDKARTIFAEKYAQNAYQDALSNFRNQQTDIYNRLSNLAGIGQTAQGSAQTLGQNTASNLAQLGIGGASALGAGQVGAANAMAGGMQNLGNSAMLYSFLRPQTQAASGYNYLTPSNQFMGPIQDVTAGG